MSFLRRKKKPASCWPERLSAAHRSGGVSLRHPHGLLASISRSKLSTSKFRQSDEPRSADPPLLDGDCRPQDFRLSDGDRRVRRDSGAFGSARSLSPGEHPCPLGKKGAQFATVRFRALAQRPIGCHAHPMRATGSVVNRTLDP